MFLEDGVIASFETEHLPRSEFEKGHSTHRRKGQKQEAGKLSRQLQGGPPSHMDTSDYNLPRVVDRVLGENPYDTRVTARMLGNKDETLTKETYKAEWRVGRREIRALSTQ